MKRFSYLLISIIITLMLAAGAIAQQQTRNDGSEKKEEQSDGLRETLAKWRIKADQKEHEELLKRGDEAAKLVEELSKSLEANKKLNDEDLTKVGKLEKIIKKIRTEIGAEDDNEPIEKNPRDVVEAISALKDTASGLIKELKKNTRHSISVVLVESSNTFLKLVRFLKFSKN